MPRCTLGLDMGTTSVKAIALDDTEQIIASNSQPCVTQSNDQGGAEQDPRQVATATLTALRQTATAATSQGYSLDAIGVSGAMHSVIALDDQGQPLTNAFIWMDNRSHAEAEELWRSEEGQAIYARTGTPIHAMSPLAKLLWLRKTQPDIFQRARRFVSLKEWVWHILTGAWEVDAGIASATGLYNLAQGSWDEGALRLAGITPDQLSTLVATTHTRTLGARGSEWGLAPETQLVIGASDGVLANLGVGALTTGVAALTIGTSSAIRMAVAAPTTDSATRRFCYLLDAGRFIAGAPSNNGGAVLEWLAHQLHGDGVDQLLKDAAQAPAGEIFCLPYLAGERAPLWNAAANASFVGLRIHHGPANLMRAAVEGILCNARWLGEALPTPPQQIIASGKVLETPWLRQIVADLFGVPVAFDGSGEASGIGAARLARIATGNIAWDQIAPSAHAVIAQPNPESPYPALYRRFRDLAAALAPFEV